MSHTQLIKFICINTRAMTYSTIWQIILTVMLWSCVQTFRITQGHCSGSQKGLEAAGHPITSYLMQSSLKYHSLDAGKNRDISSCHSPQGAGLCLPPLLAPITHRSVSFVASAYFPSPQRAGTGVRQACETYSCLSHTPSFPCLLHICLCS